MKQWIGIALVTLTLVGCGGAGEPHKPIEHQSPEFQPTKQWDPGFEPNSPRQPSSPSSRRLREKPAETTAGQAHSFFKQQCFVESTVDALTDAKAHYLTCTLSLSGALLAYVALLRNDDGLSLVAFWIKSMFHSEPLIPVAFRIDKGEVRRGEWLWSGEDNYALTPDRDVFDTLLTELPAAKRIVIRVGSEQVTIPLDDSAAAVRDFRSRIAQLE